MFFRPWPGAKREPGANPGRARHCERGVPLQAVGAGSHRRQAAATEEIREGEGGTRMRESGDLHKADASRETDSAFFIF